MGIPKPRLKNYPFIFERKVYTNSWDKFDYGFVPRETSKAKSDEDW